MVCSSASEVSCRVRGFVVQLRPSDEPETAFEDTVMELIATTGCALGESVKEAEFGTNRFVSTPPSVSEDGTFFNPGLDSAGAFVRSGLKLTVIGSSCVAIAMRRNQAFSLD